MLGTLLPFARHLKRHACDVWVFPCQDHWAYQLAVPSLGTIHDLMHRYERRFPEVGSPREYRSRESRFKGICRHASGILVDSHLGKSQVVESYDVDSTRVHVLPYTTPDYILTAASAGDDFAARHALPDKYLFYPAQFWEHKNHRRLLRALARVSAEMPEIRLVLAGSRRHEYGAVKALAEELGIGDSVLFTGYVPNDDLAEMYRRARALIMPTFFGPTNIPPLEAFATGCPVAISGIYAIPDQLGDAALLFDPEQEGQLADVMRRLWTDDRLCAMLREKGNARARSCSQAHFNETFRQIVGRVMAQGTAAPGA